MDSTPFSLSDRPGKNIKDGFIVFVSSFFLGLFLAGEWISAWVVWIFGPLALTGLVMLAIGVVRALRHGLDGSKDRHLLPAGYREKLHTFFSSHASRQKQLAADAEVPSWMIVTWFLAVLLGPALGWLITSNVIFDMRYENWRLLVGIRVGLATAIPVVLGVFIAFRYYLPTPGVRLASLIFLLGAGFASWSARASIADLLAKEPPEIQGQIEAYRKRGYLRAPWFSDGYRPNLGPYTARLSNGLLLDFYCPRICLDHYEGRRKIILIKKPVNVVYLKHLEEILEVEPTPNTPEN